MAVREIPKSYVYTCDGCRLEHKQESATGHYTDSRPPHWSRLRLARTAYDFQGCAVADASIERLLCEQCTDVLCDAINKSFAGLTN